MSKYKAVAANKLPASLITLLANAHKNKQSVVLVTGVFDVLHYEHQNFLENAKKTGDLLVVGLESDVRVRQLKGENRPKFSEQERLECLSQWNIADYIFILPEDFSKPQQHRQLIQTVKPNILAVSSHTSYIDKKRAIIESQGGKLAVVHKHNPEISTTKLLEREN